MDKLLDAAKFYNSELNGKDFRLIAAKSGRVIEFEIRFNSEHFHHLIGLQKLKDLTQVNGNRNYIFNSILNGKLTYKDIEKSEFFSDMEQRLENFKDIKSALEGEELMIKSLHGEFNSIRADFMLTHQDEGYGYAHLFLREDREAITVPVTFIINADNKYLQNNPNKWGVLSVEEVRKAGKNTEIVEVEPLRIFKQNDKAVLVKLPGVRVEDKKPLWLSNKEIKLNQGGDAVIGVREHLQQKYSLRLPQGQLKRFLK